MSGPRPTSGNLPMTVDDDVASGMMSNISEFKVNSPLSSGLGSDEREEGEN